MIPEDRAIQALVVLHYPVFGGPHNQFLRLDAAFARAGIKLTIALTDEPGNAAERLRDAGVDVVTLPLARLRANLDPRWMLRFGRGFSGDVEGLHTLITARDFDAVIVSGLVNPHGALAAARSETPVVWQIIDTRTPAALTPFFMRIARRHASSFMFWGEGLVSTHAGRRPITQPIEIFGPAVDTDAFGQASLGGGAIRDSLKIPRDAPLVGTLANVNPQKGIEYFGRAAIRIYERHPDTWFAVIGAIYPHYAKYAQGIKDEMVAGGIPPERVLFVGETRDAAAWLGACDVKLITSVPRSEGIPTTAVEAMAAGVPVVSVDVGAVREAVIDGVTGLVVPPGDVVAIADATCRVLEDRHWAKSISEIARARVEKYFSVDACVGAHRRAIETALKCGVRETQDSGGSR